MTDSQEDRTSGIRHTHSFVAEATLPRMQSTHDLLRWDVAKSRILSASLCSVCGDVEVASLEECKTSDCQDHRICQKPYR